jgi:hypothetical protein
MWREAEGQWEERCDGNCSTYSNLIEMEEDKQVVGYRQEGGKRLPFTTME